jgi:hypothetical protein
MRRISAAIVCTALCANVPLASSVGASDQGEGFAIVGGRILDERGEFLSDVRVRATSRGMDPNDQDKLVVAETTSGKDGRYEVRVPLKEKTAAVDVEASKPGFRSTDGVIQMGGAIASVLLSQDKRTAASFVLRPALYVSGTVVDEQGDPVAGVSIVPVLKGDADEYVGFTTSDRDGRFELFEFPPRPSGVLDLLVRAEVSFQSAGFLPKTIGDLYAVEDDALRQVKVVLPAGRFVAGRLLDAAGNPVSATLIEVVFDDPALRQATLTDDEGRFKITGLASGEATLRSHAIGLRQKTVLPLTLDRDHDDMELRLKPYQLMHEPTPVEVLGVTVCDVTPELQDIYDLDTAQGVLVLGLGEAASPLRLDNLAVGDCFTVVDFTSVTNVRDFIERLLASARKTSIKPTATYDLQVLFKARRVEFDGQDASRIELTENDVDALRTTLAALKASP